jgi:hypothetical protein
LCAKFVFCRKEILPKTSGNSALTSFFQTSKNLKLEGGFGNLQDALLIDLLLSDGFKLEDIGFVEDEFKSTLEELLLYKTKETAKGIEGLKEAANLIFKDNFYSCHASLLLVLLTENLDNTFENEIENLARGDDKIATEIANILLSGVEAFSSIQKEALLHSVPLFNTLSPEFIGMLAMNVQVNSYPKDTHLVHEGDDGDTLFIITKGSASVLVKTQYGEKIVARVVENDYIGEIAIFSGEKRTASVRADEDVEAMVLSMDTLKQVVNYKPSVSFDIMREMTLRLLEQKNTKD